MGKTERLYKFYSIQVYKTIKPSQERIIDYIHVHSGPCKSLDILVKQSCVENCKEATPNWFPCFPLVNGFPFSLNFKENIVICEF